MTARDQYSSPLAERYASKAMLELWSPNVRYGLWRQLWLALAQAQKGLGLDMPAADIRALAVKVGGTAMHWRGNDAGQRFHPLNPAVLRLHRELKQKFDPHGIFNRGRLIPEL